MRYPEFYTNPTWFVTPLLLVNLLLAGYYLNNERIWTYKEMQQDTKYAVTTVARTIGLLTSNLIDGIKG